MSNVDQSQPAWGAGGPDPAGYGSYVSPPAAPAPVPSAGWWERRDWMLVLLVGVFGGIVASVVAEAHFWVQNFPLRSLEGIGAGLRMFRFYGLAGPILVTHAIFVGMLTRKPGTVVATAAVGLLPAALVGAGIEYLVWRDDLHLNWGQVLIFYVFALVIVAGIAEGILAVGRTGSAGWLVDALAGLSIPAGWLLYFGLQYVLPFGQAPWTEFFGLLDWIVFLGLTTVWALLVSGLLPAAIARVIRRRREAGSGPSPSQQWTAAAQPWAAGTGPSYPGQQYPGQQYSGQPYPGQPYPGSYQPDHPSATTALVLGILGLVVFAPLAPFAWGIAAKARTEIRQSPGRYRAAGSLQAGYVLGIIGTVLLALGILAGIGLALFYISIATRG